jgi:hypothetical protein
VDSEVYLLTDRRCIAVSGVVLGTVEQVASSVREDWKQRSATDEI